MIYYVYMIYDNLLKFHFIQDSLVNQSHWNCRNRHCSSEQQWRLIGFYYYFYFTLFFNALSTLIPEG
jgi:hypothetical protein